MIRDHFFRFLEPLSSPLGYILDGAQRLQCHLLRLTQAGRAGDIQPLIRSRKPESFQTFTGVYIPEFNSFIITATSQELPIWAETYGCNCICMLL